MKKTKLFLAATSLALFGLNSCQKDEITDSATSKGNSELSVRKEGEKGSVYIMDNATTGNSILVYSRNQSGNLTADGTFTTGGLGTGGGLGSQGSLILNDGYLYACNAGSNEVSVLRTTDSGLTLVDKVSSNGMRPISVTVNDNMLYVLNAGGSGNISGFIISENHHLTPIANSTKPLSSSASGPAQIEFNKSGSQLVVSEKATNNILTYSVNDNGTPSNAVVHPSVGNTPFGFEFSKNGKLIVSDAFGGMAGQSALTSYSLSNSGNLNTITGPVGNGQAAACWVVITSNNKYCYTTNTASGNISGYNVGTSGNLTLLDLNGITATTEGGPIDMSLSEDSKYLYTLNASGHSISMFSVNNNGSLTSIGNLSNVPVGSVGMAAE